jgi:hypothetical protein
MRKLLLGTIVGLSALASFGCSSGSSQPAASGCGDLTAAASSEFCAGDPASPNCDLVTAAYKIGVCGVPLKQPPGELSRSENVEEYAGSGPPNLSCYTAAGYPTAGASETVTVSGIAKIFSNGCESSDLAIEFFRVKRTSGEDDGELGDPVGAAVVTDADCEATGVASDDPDKCDTRFECKYEYAGVPTETELVVKTSGGNKWAPLYDYNVYIPNGEVEGGVWDHDVRALAQDDYTVIPQAAIGGPVTQGHGVVAGEVHDCDNIRLINATVDVDRDKVITNYFTSDEEHPLPDLSAKATTALSLYASMDIAPGPVTVAATGLVGGQPVTVGYVKARIFPDAVTAVTFRGLRPFQIVP